ncbi:hypothetical protein CNMCM6936_002825 [Aspergillus lentulus]|nr:hypothetical protein CNMCM6936_002825 [Aspergillus lentulus]
MASMANAASGPSKREVISEADWLAAEKGERPLPEVAPRIRSPLVPVLPGNRRLPSWTTPQRILAQGSPATIGKLDSAAHSLDTLFPIAGSPYSRRRQRHHVPQCWALAYLHYPHVEAINQKLSAKNKGWRGSTEGKHWLTLQSHLRSCRPFAAIGVSIATGVQSQAEDDITVPDLVEEYVCRAGIVSRHPLSFDKDLNRFVVSTETSLESLTTLKGEMRYVSDPGRYDLLQGVMERIVANIESLRTAKWMEDPYRSPAVLPSRFQMDMLLLPSPDRNPRAKNPAMEFGRSLMVLLEKFADDPLLLVEFDAVKQEVSDVEERDLASFALLLGSDVEEDKQPLYRRLNIDIARRALERTNLEDLRQNEQLMAMIHRWKASRSEWVRQVGWNFDGTF